MSNKLLNASIFPKAISYEILKSWKSRNWQPIVVSNSCYNIMYTDMDTETKPFSSSAYHIFYNIMYTDMDTETKPFSSSAYHILPAEAAVCAITGPPIALRLSN